MYRECSLHQNILTESYWGVVSSCWTAMSEPFNFFIVFFIFMFCCSNRSILIWLACTWLDISTTISPVPIPFRHCSWECYAWVIEDLHVVGVALPWISLLTGPLRSGYSTINLSLSLTWLSSFSSSVTCVSSFMIFFFSSFFSVSTCCSNTYNRSFSYKQATFEWQNTKKLQHHYTCLLCPRSEYMYMAWHLIARA